MRLATAIVAALLLAVAARAEVGEWVTVTLKDGREHFGQIVEETDHKLVVNVRIGAVASRLTFARRDVAKVESRGFLGDRKPEVKQENEEDELPGPTPPPEGEGGYAIVPLKGSIGEEITTDFVRAVLTRAKNSRAEAVIFEVDSPGGMVVELDRLREEVDRFAGDVIVAFYTEREALSAAALLCLSNPKFYVGDGARVGAAVAFARSSSGAAEVDAKFNSAFAATWRALAEKAGRSGLLVDAMVLPERALIADTGVTPWTLMGEPPAGRKLDATLRTLDEPGSVLTLTAADAVATGAANAKAASARVLVGMLGLRNSGREVFDGAALSKAHLRMVERNMAVVRRAIEDYDDAVTLLKNEKTAAGAKATLREMRSALTRMVTLYRKHDYVRNAVDGAGDSVEDYERLIRRINELIKEL